MLIRVRVARFLPKFSTIWPILRIGLPVTVGQLTMSLGTILINRVLSTYGQTAVAGYGAASRVDFFVALPTLALAGAAVTIIGMFAGAGRADLVRSITVYTYKWVLLLVITVGTGALVGSAFIMRAFTEDTNVIEVGTGYLTFMVVGYPLMAFGITSGRILQGIGKGTPSLVINAIRVIALWVPLSYVGVYLFHTPIEWVWAAGLIGGLVSNLVAAFWVRRNIWQEDPTRWARAKGGGAAL
jgi:Na+-driven multidrug efflux pump